jgi:hypothetical protein
MNRRLIVRFLLIAALLITSVPRPSGAEDLKRIGDGAKVLIGLLREAEKTGRNADVRNQLKQVRSLIEAAADAMKDTSVAGGSSSAAFTDASGQQVTAMRDLSRARDLLRQIVDEPRDESADFQEKVAEALKAVEESTARMLGDGTSSATTDTAFGLHTATFDTLQGTVTANLPDDLSAGDTISGTVVAEAKGKTEDEKARNQDQLNGYVVELEKQPAPVDDKVAKWAIPSTVATAIPLVLKNREGKEVARAMIPVKPQPEAPLQGSSKQKAGKQPSNEKNVEGSPSKPREIYAIPALAQAGKPLAIKGPFDGNITTTAIKIANQAASVLAESPRQVIAQTPAGLIGPGQVQLKKQDRVVAEGKLVSVGVRLSAAKLNLVRGETTMMTVSVLGGESLTVPVVVNLVNRSPWVVRMEGGQRQRLSIDPKQLNGAAVTTQRSLTGLRAGGFAITATVDQALVAGTDRAAPSRGENPLTHQPGGSGGQRETESEPIDSDGNPRRSLGPAPVSSLSGNFRVTLTGFRVNHQTKDDRLERDGAGDEVTFIHSVGVVDRAGSFTQLIGTGSVTGTLGQTPPNGRLAGRATPTGGLRTDDTFPTSTPWVITTPVTTGNPPRLLFDGALTQGRDAAVIISSIWEVDGPSSLESGYSDAMARDRASLARIVSRLIAVPPTSALLPGRALGISNTVTLGRGPLGLGQVDDRPIGMQAIGGNFGFTPQVLVLTYDGARELARRDAGFGRGVIEIRYVDDQWLEGDYSLFVKVEDMSYASERCAPLTTTFDGEATLTTSHEDPRLRTFRKHLTFNVEFLECRSVVSIPSLPEISEEFEVSPGVRNRTDVVRTDSSSGTFDQSSGRLSIPFTIEIRNTHPLAPTSSLSMVLTTDGGAPVSSSGQITLAGGGRFRDGFFNRLEGRLEVTGRLSPNPRP